MGGLDVFVLIWTEGFASATDDLLDASVLLLLQEVNTRAFATGAEVPLARLIPHVCNATNSLFEGHTLMQVSYVRA